MLQNLYVSTKTKTRNHNNDKKNILANNNIEIHKLKVSIIIVSIGKHNN